MSVLESVGRQIGEDVAAYLFNGSKQASAAAQINEALEENLRPLRKDVAEFNGRLEQLQNDLELPSIGWQLFILDSSQSDPIALPAFLDTYATRLLTEPLR